MSKVPHLRKDRECAVCKGTPTKLVRERIAGSQGRMSQSFANSYRLCEKCLSRVRSIAGIDCVNLAHGRWEECVTVYARALEWLKRMHNDRP